jgi:LysM repeat protein
MNKLVTGLLISIISIQGVIAQPAQLMVKSGDKGLHLDHTVTAKEGFFSIGRLYDVHPKALASYNNLDINKGLAIGQVIEVPLTDTNFTQKSNKGTPIYYKVGEKEGLMKVSNSNNKVTMQRLRDWNKLTNDNIKPGSKLIVGFLITNETPATTVPATVKEIPKQTTEDKPSTKTTPVTDKATVKEEPKKEEPKIEEPKREEVKKEEAKKTSPAIVKQEVTTNMSGQGYFKSFFDKQVKVSPISKTETVTSGIFKTTSGWEDAKFYLLIDAVPSGTIVRIINPENNKAIYAKVLGEMNGIRQNQGLNIRMSNAAASTLGITDTEKFIVKLNY